MGPSRALLSLVLLAAACGPTLSESRLASYRARVDDCELGLVEVNGTDKRLGAEWRVIGYVSVGGLGRTDPLAQRNRELVRARICKMGGLAVTIATPGTNGMAVEAADDAVTYAVLRPAVEPAPETPNKF